MADRHIGHHEVMPGSAASPALALETPAGMAATMSGDGCWASH
jgi:hypothetical protein